MKKSLLFLIFLSIPLITFSQTKEDRIILNSLQENIRHIQSLSKEEGDASEEAQYIKTQFHLRGLQPAAGQLSFFQFIIKDYGKSYDMGTALSISGKELALNKDYVPLPYSAGGSVKGDPLIAVQEPNLPWIMDISQYSGTQLTGKDTDIRETMYKLASQAMHDKATAILFYNSNNSAPDIAFNTEDRKAALSIPVVYINHRAAAGYFKDQTSDARIDLKVQFYDKKDTAYNVIGELNNGAASTITFCAQQPEAKAAFLTLIPLLKDNKYFRNKNYLFVSLSEKDGTGYYFEHPSISPAQTDCMIFLNSRSPLETASSSVTVSGMQTSSQWGNILRKVKVRGITVQYSSDEEMQPKSLPSVPALTVSSAAGNEKGELEAIRFLTGLIKELNRSGNLTAAN